jgi:hypothetical protein
LKQYRLATQTGHPDFGSLRQESVVTRISGYFRFSEASYFGFQLNIYAFVGYESVSASVDLTT